MNESKLNNESVGKKDGTVASIVERSICTFLYTPYCLNINVWSLEDTRCQEQGIFLQSGRWSSGGAQS